MTKEAQDDSFCMQKKNILVLGGAGFIGSNLCERLVAENVNVICVDNFITSQEQNINHLLKQPNFEFLKHDINESLDLEKARELKNFQLPVFGIQEVYNLACPTTVQHFEKLKLETIRANSMGMYNSLELAVKYKSKFLQASSSVVYGEADKAEKYVEEKFQGPLNQLDPRACYDEGKRFAETMVEVYKGRNKLDVKIARIFRTYGPKMPLGDGQMIPDFILNSLEGKDMEIFGDTKFKTTLCYVTDIVEALIKLMDSDVSEPINLGGTEILTWKQIAEKTKEITGSKSKVTHHDEKLFMRELPFPNIQKAKDELGWIPLIGLADGLKKTIDYMQAHKSLVGFSG